MRLFPYDAVVAVHWHRPVWHGRPQPRRPVDTGVRVEPGEYRFEKQKKFARRFMAAQRGERPYPRPLSVSGRLKRISG